MKPFVGFPSGPVRQTPIPDLFFTELLPAIESREELALTLFMFWSLHRQTGYPRYLTFAELENETVLQQAFARSADGDPNARLREAVDRAFERGTLLRLCIADPEGELEYLFLNTPQGRKAVDQVKDGSLILERRGFVREPQPIDPRPSIYELYEQNVGLLQPLIAEQLQQAEADYPPEWIEDAFRIAVESNVRNWRYIAAILERWSREGKDDGDWGSRQGARRAGRR
jgi:DNA replication protein